MKGPVGLGGWLVLPMIGFFGTIGVTAFNLAESFRYFDGLLEILSASSGPLVSLKLPILSSMFGGVAVIVSAAACLFLIFRKNSLIVKVATAHYLILAVVSILEVWGEAKLREALPNQPADPSVVKDAVRACFAALIWIPYFHISKRVRNTFQAPGIDISESASVVRPASSDTNP